MLIKRVSSFLFYFEYFLFFFFFLLFFCFFFSTRDVAAKGRRVDRTRQCGRSEEQRAVTATAKPHRPHTTSATRSNSNQRKIYLKKTHSDRRKMKRKIKKPNKFHSMKSQSQRSVHFSVGTNRSHIHCAVFPIKRKQKRNDGTKRKPTNLSFTR